MNKKLLVVIDMQNDFITGALGNKECQAVVPAVAAKVKSAEGNADIVYTLDTHTEDIIFTKDTHGEDYMNTQEGRNLPVKHCIKPDNGWKLIPELEGIKAVRSFEKPTFGSIELAEWIKENGYTEVELIGVCTDICVISNAMTIKAVNPEVVISVDAKCCAGVTPESHANALAAMKACQIEVL